MRGFQGTLRGDPPIKEHHFPEKIKPPANMAPDRESLEEESRLPGTLPQVPCLWKEG